VEGSQPVPESQAPALPAAAPVSSKSIMPPARPGVGTVGRKVMVRANHFLVGFADKDICHYDVSHPLTYLSSSSRFFSATGYYFCWIFIYFDTRSDLVLVAIFVAVFVAIFLHIVKFEP
jgi:hypothetical protein